MDRIDISVLWPAIRRLREKAKRGPAIAKSRRERARRSKPTKQCPARCQACGRKPGARRLGRFGDLDPNPQTPLGPLQKCRSCGLWACPDCWHEVDCCFRDEAEHEDDPNWAPPGWKRVNDEWIREGAA